MRIPLLGAKADCASGEGGVSAAAPAGSAEAAGEAEGDTDDMRPNMAPIGPRFQALFAHAAAAVALLAAVAGLAACSPRSHEQAPVTPPVAIGGPFRLIDQTGTPRNESLLEGKWTAVFFGYTYCPDVCPTTLQALGGAIDDLGPDARHVQVVFITVDPARDTPRQLAAYLASPSFPRGVIGLTGSPEEIAAAARAYRAFYARHGDGPGYTMDHTAVVYLMDPKGKFLQPLDVAAPPPRIAASLRRAMAMG